MNIALLDASQWSTYSRQVKTLKSRRNYVLRVTRVLVEFSFCADVTRARDQLASQIMRGPNCSYS